jgi:glycosyltransferase involved in cell wall biosynthesis
MIKNISIPKKILLLGDINSSHTIKWATALLENSFEVAVFSFGDSKKEYLSSSIKNLKVFSINISKRIQHRGEFSIAKIKYIAGQKFLKKIIHSYSPDIIHAHYASSYGLVGALTGFHPYFISVWGTDILSFPNNSIFHKLILKFNLSKADKIFATSKYLATETKKFTAKKVYITPFGIDADVFKPMQVDSHFRSTELVIGTVKRLEKNYGIRYLIEAFDLVCKKFPDKQLRLLIVGEGSESDFLKKMVIKNKISDKVTFTGLIPYNEVVKFHNMMDIEVIPSLRESFGVSVLEASSCGKPVIVTSVGGLPETVEEGKTGLIVEPANIEELSCALIKLIEDKNLRTKMGENGRSWIIENFQWRNIFSEIKHHYY